VLPTDYIADGDAASSHGALAVDWIKLRQWQTNSQNYPPLIKFSKLPITIFYWQKNKY